MLKPAIPLNEAERLSSLHALKLLDTAAEERFDRITRLAARLFNVPVALVSLVDRDRQWFKSKQGIDACETGRDISFCGHAILREGPLVVPDASADPDFADNPLVTGAPHIRFYAGQPVHAPDGSRVGTLCLISPEPRPFSDDDRAQLADLGAMVDREFSVLQMATTDELTKLSNRRGFAEIAWHVLALCRRTSRPASLAALDIDRFRIINETLGRAEGDRVLRSFGTQLTVHFRSSDVVSRLGADEFCVLAGGATELEMIDALERFAVSFARSELAATHPRLSWSAGIVELGPASPNSIDEILKIADRNMRAPKKIRTPGDIARTR